MRKIKRIAKFEGLEPRRCEDIKGIVVPDIGPKSFGTFEKLPSYFCFYSLYNISKDQLYRISRSYYYEWLFGPEKFSGISRNGPQVGKLSPKLAKSGIPTDQPILLQIERISLICDCC